MRSGRPSVGAGGLLGAVLGGGLAFAVTKLTGTRYTLLAAAVLLLAVPLLVVLIERAKGPVPVAPPRHRRERYEEARGGWRTLRGSRLLALISLLMLATVMVGQLVQWQFNWWVEFTTQTLDQRTSMFSIALSLVGVVGFFFQLIFSQLFLSTKISLT